jgi:hypothetical protein
VSWSDRRDTNRRLVANVAANVTSAAGFDQRAVRHRPATHVHDNRSRLAPESRIARALDAETERLENVPLMVPPA